MLYSFPGLSRRQNCIHIFCSFYFLTFFPSLFFVFFFPRSPFQLIRSSTCFSFGFRLRSGRCHTHVHIIRWRCFAVTTHISRHMPSRKRTRAGCFPAAVLANGRPLGYLNNARCVLKHLFLGRKKKINEIISETFR